jgi:polyisoprenoid-binding protein YceI
MVKPFFRSMIAVVVFGTFAVLETARAADNFGVDSVHSGVYFKIKHLDLAYVFGRFNEFSGSFAVDKDDPAKCSFNLDIKTNSVDTGTKARDDHLRSPDFFNVKQFPAMTFKSTAVKAIKGGYEVTGDLTMHGVTKPLTFNLMGGGISDTKGQKRTGFWTELILKRADFGITTFDTMLSNDVHVAVSIEGTKK